MGKYIKIKRETNEDDSVCLGILWLVASFLISLQCFSVTTMGNRHIEKVLLKLSSTFKLRNFDIGMKMITIAPYHLIFIYLMRSEYYQLVWAIVLSIPKVMRRPECRIKQIVSTPFLCLYLKINCLENG